MGTVVHIPWYATGFRADTLETELEEIAAASLRYGATGYRVYRSRDDRYKFLHASTFETKLEWERYWNGPEFIQWREKYGGWYQIPVLYTWHDMVLSGVSELAENGEVPV